MKQIFESVKEIEKSISPFFSEDENLAELLMIENAAAALEKVVKKTLDKKNCKNKKSVLIMCGAGNNGADGYALARHLSGFCKINLLQVSKPKSFACAASFKNLSSLLKNEINLIEYNEEKNISKIESKIKSIAEKSSIIVDCIFGTGFHDLVDEKIQSLFKIVNHVDVIKIACDIPSGLSLNAKNISGFSLQQKKHFVFCADITVTMGALKSTLFFDDAKDLVGKIKCAPIGVSDKLFLKNYSDKIFLLEKSDLVLPIRKVQNVHKGSFGHVTVVSGEKLGASILASSAAFKVGAGLSSILIESKFEDFNNEEKIAMSQNNVLAQEKNQIKNISYIDFKIPASTMICNELPLNCTTLILGPGLGRQNDSAFVKKYLDFAKEKSLSIVLDADSFYYDETYNFLSEVCAEKIQSENKEENKTQKNLENQKNDSLKNQQKIILTPHPKEFAEILRRTEFGEFSVQQILQNKIELMREFCKKYKNVVLVLKGANTFICKKNKIYICDLGTQALAKGGSGDVLTGAVAGLLAQKYDALDAAISGVLMHALASRKFDGGYFLTPEELIEKL